MPKTGMSWEARATIIAAVIGLVGVIITGIFSYMGARSAVDVPISATQTAVALANTATRVAALITATSSPVPTTVAPTSVSLISTATPEPLPIDFDTSAPPGCYPTGLPSYIRPAQDPAQASATFEKVPEQEKVAWAELPSPRDPNGQIQIDFWLENTNKGTEWIRLANTMNVQVQVHPMSAPLDAYKESCGGGGGEIREFPPLDLHTGADSYIAHSTYSKFDFFTLQPGEVEEFRLTLQCADTSAYDITVEIPYTFKKTTGNLTWRSPHVMVCPKSFTLWDSFDNFQKIGTYNWNGKEYESQ